MFQDGTEVPAVPIHEPSYFKTAEQLGYGLDIAQMSREHETLHCFLAARMGLGASPTLWAVAHKEKTPVGLMHDEEARVMSFQRLMNGCELDAGDQHWLSEITTDGALLQRWKEEALRLLRGDEVKA